MLRRFTTVAKVFSNDDHNKSTDLIETVQSPHAKKMSIIDSFDLSEGLIQLDDYNEDDEVMKKIIEKKGKLEEWSGKTVAGVVYDSKKHHRNTYVIDKKLLGRSSVYFIVIDDSNKCFGGYFGGKINRIGRWNVCENIFVFTMNENGEEDKAAMFKKTSNCGVYLYKCDDKELHHENSKDLKKADEEDIPEQSKSNKLFSFDNAFTVSNNDSYCWCQSEHYEKLSEKSLNGKFGNAEPFKVSRIIIYQMK